MWFSSSCESPIHATRIIWNLKFSISRVFFLSYRDGDPNARPKWLFQTDLVDKVVVAFSNDNDYIPVYNPAEDDDATFIRPRSPTMTPYRLLVTLSAICFGTTKAYLSFRGGIAGPRALEWVFSAVVSLR